MLLHVEALALLERVWGTLGLITSGSLLLLAAGTRGGLERQELWPGTGTGPVWLLTAGGVILALFSAGALAAARGLRRRQTGGRRAALVFAVPNHARPLHVLGSAERRRPAGIRASAPRGRGDRRATVRFKSWPY
jgi:hypothetical protein